MANQNPQNNLTDEDRSRGGSHSGGNFKNDPERAAEAGRKGGERSHGGGGGSSGGGRGSSGSTNR